MATVLINIDAYVPAPLYIAISLSTYVTSDVCGKTTKNMQSSTASFAANSLLYELNNSLAASGWYSDGTNKGYWDGSVISSFQSCITPFSVTLNSVSGGCVAFTTAGPTPASINVEYTIDNGVTWVKNTGSLVSPRCGFAAPTKPTKYRMSSVEIPVVYSNIIEIFPAMTGYNYTSVYVRNDPAHPNGGTFSYVDINGVTINYSGLWSDTCFAFQSQTVPSLRVGIDTTTCEPPLV